MHIQAGISARVRDQYEAFPYPHYGLFIPLRTQEAYASGSLFAARVLEQLGRQPAVRAGGSPLGDPLQGCPPRGRPPRVLIAGCGDTLPFMMAAWEPRRHRLAAADLSAGALRRARLRCLPLLRGIDWLRGNLEDPAFALPDGLSHIDCYGVLHHLSDPARVLRRFGGLLLPGGTARVMVYNSAARAWLRHIQKALALLGLSAFRREDREEARRLLDRLARISPVLRLRFAAMGRDAFDNPSRLVDTFFHAREARLGLDGWLRAVREGGLDLVGVRDRLGELDDLPNPLLTPPETAAWRERIADRRCEENLELFLARPGPEAAGRGGAAPARLPTAQFLKPPPLAWFGYTETRTVPGPIRGRLWRHFLRRLSGRPGRPIDGWAGRLGPEALGRLGRIGALFPDDFESPELREALRRPLQESMDPPDPPVRGLVKDDRELRGMVEAILLEHGRPARQLPLVMERLSAAQCP